METNVKKLMMIFAAVAMTACESKDVYDEQIMEKTQKLSYSENFKNKYPNISLNQNWDYSTKTISYGLGETSKARTRGGSGSWSVGSWYEVDNNTLTWMHEQLVEGDDHRNLGNPFYMSVPGNDFTIVPIYQGVAAAVWDLHVVVDGQDYLVWSKSQDLEIKDQCECDWHSVVHGTFEWPDAGEVFWESLSNTDGSDKIAPNGEKNVVTNVRAKARTFSGFPVGANMYFYLKVTTSGNYDNYILNEVGAEQSSLNGMMLALEDVPRPANIPADYETMIIGCEDADLRDSDWDINDVVFLVYGKTVPKPIKIEQGETVYENKTVRYMIEDLGATDDFDFNDIVVDVTESTPKTAEYTNGVFTRWIYGTTKTQKAVIRHLGGTLPFILRIGNTEYAAGGQAAFQSSPDTEIVVEGWNMTSHNISVEVQQQGNEGVYNNVRFPRAGEAPMIIAVDPSQDWMPERQSVPETWFYTNEE